MPELNNRFWTCRLGNNTPCRGEIDALPLRGSLGLPGYLCHGTLAAPLFVVVVVSALENRSHGGVSAPCRVPGVQATALRVLGALLSSLACLLMPF
jgi:hypothetical protein